jgi:hypothetical protein
MSLSSQPYASRKPKVSCPKRPVPFPLPRSPRAQQAPCVIGVYSVKLVRAQMAGDADTSEKLDRMIRCHMKDLKTTKIAREGEETQTPTTSPAEWAAALLEKVADKKTVDKPTDNRKKPKKISDNTKPEEKEDGDSAEIMAD